MKVRLLIILLTMPFIRAFSGFNEKVPIKWGKINASEFNINSYNKDSTVHAIVLCDFGNIEISNRTYYTRHTRIKIIDEDGLKYAE
jgi:hypothetical protein